MLKKITLLFILSLLFSCGNKHIENVSDLNGYWEILHVKQNNTKLKDYKVNTTVDYFEVKKGSGFRKKVVPQFTGKYLVSQHKSTFTLKTENDSLHIYYNTNEIAFKETIIKLSKEELIISNTDGFIYTYKPFEALNLDL